jgi:hypothetical protein
VPKNTEDKTLGKALGGKKIVTATELQKEVNALKAIVTLHDEAIARMIFLLRSMKEGDPQGHVQGGMDTQKLSSEAERIVRQSAAEGAKRAEKKAAG